MSEIFKAINAVMNEVGYVPKKRSSGINYSFAGEAALIEAIRPEMVKQGLFLFPTAVRENITTYTTKTGSVMNWAIVVVTYRFAHTSGEGFDVQVTGEGADVGDKAFNKAMTGAYKYALRQTFCIETGDDPDKYPSEDYERNEPGPPVRGPVVTKKPAATNGVTADQQKPTAEMLKALHAAGSAFYGSEWDMRRKDLVHAVTKGRSDSSKHLTREECQKLIDGIAAKADSNG